MLRFTSQIPRTSFAHVQRQTLRQVTPTRFYATARETKASIRRNGLISVALLIGAAGAYYYETIAPDGSSVDSSDASAGQPFSLRVGGKTQTFVRKSDKETEAMLHANEDGQMVGRKGNPVIRWDRNWLGSNEPCEDRSAVDILPRKRGVSDQKSILQSLTGGMDAPRPNAVEGDRDIAMFSIIDGHAGDATSKLLSKALHPTLAISLAGLQAGVPTGWQALNPAAWFSGKSWNPAGVTDTLKKAFLQLDENICQTPVRMLPSVQKPVDPAASPSASQLFVTLAGPAESGACAISTVVDAENDELYVALAGDCRAVAGWQDAQGRWRCDTLSEDQMGENPREIARMRSEHPANERETVIMRGRVQGGLQPTRAFGDAMYKWTRSQADQIADVFKSEGLKTRKQRPSHLTPPYVTAEPAVTHRPLVSPNGDKLRFVILATDGLWDRITSEEATLLVASYINHQSRPDVAKAALASEYPLVPSSGERPYPAEDLPGSPSRSAGTWVFENDKNAATHLIRNSLAGGDRKLRGELLSLHGETTRWLRDDITVNVVFFRDTDQRA